MKKNFEVKIMSISVFMNYNQLFESLRGFVLLLVVSIIPLDN